MSKPQDISSYEELEQRKRELDLEVKVTKRELAHSLGTSRVNLNEFLLKRIALPIGGAIAGVWLVGKLRKKPHRHTHEVHEKTIVREVPTDDYPAVNHFPVPPPKADSDDKTSDRYVPRTPKYQRPNRAYTPPPASPSTPKKKKGLDKQDKKNLVNAATLASIARVAVPAVKAIYGAIEKYKASQQEAAAQTPVKTPASDELTQVS